MAKKTTKIAFSTGEISVQNGRYIITEIDKDGSIDYDLSSVLDSFVRMQNVSLSINATDEVPDISE